MKTLFILLLLCSTPAQAAVSKSDVGHINLEINQSIRPTGVNCKEYAAAKFQRLAPLVPVGDIKKLTVYVQRAHKYHMVVKIRVEDEWIVLDNLTNTLVPLELMAYRLIKESD